MSTDGEKAPEAGDVGHTAAGGGQSEAQALPALADDVTRSCRAWEIFRDTVARAAVTDSRAARTADARVIAAGSFRLADEFVAEEARQADPEYRGRFSAEIEARRLGELRYLPVLVRGGREIRGQAALETVDAAQDAIRETAVAAAAQGKRYDAARIEVQGVIGVELPAFKEPLDDDLE